MIFKYKVLCRYGETIVGYGTIRNIINCIKDKSLRSFPVPVIDWSKE